MYRSIVPDILAAYELDYQSIGELQKGYRNESYAVTLVNGQTINLMIFKREPHILERIRRADATSRYAADAELPVRTRYHDRLLKIRSDTYAGLYRYLPGRTIAWEMYSMKHIKLLGWAMGDLHQALASIRRPDDYSVYDELSILVERMRSYFGDADIQRAVEQKLGVSITTNQLDEFTRLIKAQATLPDQQMLHMDMVRGNVLFGVAASVDRWQIDGTALSGIIDFEKAAYGHVICDAARTLAFLLVDCPKSPDKVYKYFLESGYLKRSGVELPYRERMDEFVRLFLLHDFYKFLKHTPYESLARNHHYVRTKELLLKYGMISSKN